MENKRTVWGDGFMAATNGEWSSGNPYELFSVDWDNWLCGWWNGVSFVYQSRQFFKGLD